MRNFFLKYVHISQIQRIFLLLVLLLVCCLQSMSYASQPSNYQCIDTILDYLNTTNKWNAPNQDATYLQNFYNDMNSWDGVFVLYNPNRIEIRQVSGIYDISSTRVRYNQTTGRYYTIYTTGNNSGRVDTSNQSYGNGDFYYTDNFNSNAYNTGVFIIGTYNGNRVAYQKKGFNCFDINNGIIQTSEYIPEATWYMDRTINISGGQVVARGLPVTSYLTHTGLGTFINANPIDNEIVLYKVASDLTTTEVYNWAQFTFSEEENIEIPENIIELNKIYMLEWTWDKVTYEHYYYFWENIEVTEGMYQNASGEWIYGIISGDRLKEQQENQLYEDIQNINNSISNLTNNIANSLYNNESGEISGENNKGVIQKVYDDLFKINTEEIKTEIKNWLLNEGFNSGEASGEYQEAIART